MAGGSSMRRSVPWFAAGVFLCSISYAQEPQPATQETQGEAQLQQPAPPPPSLGEIARQLKLKKQQKEAQLQQAKAAANPNPPAADSTASPAPAETAQLITKDESPERASVTPVSTHSTSEPAEPKAVSDHQADAEKWKSQILQQKTAIAALQEDIKTTSDSIHYAGANCVANCAPWNEKQQQKQQEVDTMKAQLEDAKKQLEEMQEAARKEGFGSTVYDP